jgi:hypothetical protein
MCACSSAVFLRLDADYQASDALVAEIAAVDLGQCELFAELRSWIERIVSAIREGRVISSVRRRYITFRPAPQRGAGGVAWSFGYLLTECRQFDILQFGPG